ncbi:centromere-associated protein E isoform X1 [Cavia porcellus]|uniref:Centromere-associated protein E n=1 Tax=Cavia porcellus TaxID=10141 RepID=H0V4X9_CAVPO|nr:centromere-associated protein E [Cavia porcellus]
MAEAAAVAVCVRVRPLSSREEELGEAPQIYWKTDHNVIYQVDGSKSFNFDRVFHSNETTANVYEEIAVPIIDSAIQGYNGTIFAYGQTASGKTHTMMGSEDCLGVIPRAIHDIFQKIKKFADREFLLRVSYMEIYNDTIADLLCSTQKMKPLLIREDINRNVYVADLTEEVVYTSEMALRWITKGEKNRHYGTTKMNERSSRSHTIFRMILESREKGEPSNCDGSIKVSHLNLVDLAGSERAAQTGAEGVRFKEGCNINRSLFILGQVIKKLSDEQIGGFINYRDSKLTRILQNSLGGNAKTRIICTITPASFEETLTTLQFASTAKYMKNTPYVNEVSSDEALLKRYRKEIVDLRKQLEEVNIKTRAQEMEKDQLAQLLDEKDLLQKVQDEKIHNLTRMLVTSSSLTSHQELKAKRKRRVTWCFGKINKMKDSNYEREFSIPVNVTTRTSRNAVTLLGEIDETFLESDTFSNTPDTLTEIEWNSATQLLNEENLESELNSLRAKYDNMVLDYEQVRRENEEMRLKLKERSDLDEFEALERKTEKDQEMQLIHEISNLRNLVKHAEVYNQDLENELSSKVALLREKEAEIKKLQNYIDSQKSESTALDSPFPRDNDDDFKEMKQSLFDAETVALDAKREAAFLRSANLELKKQMKELANTCKQMEIDTQVYQSQLEAKKKIQVDLEKELQSAFSEITKLTSLVDGKLPKDLPCNLELERRITDLQKELSKEIKENEALQKEINLLSELKSLPPEIETLKKEMRDRSEELSVVTSERDRLCSEVTQKDSRIQALLEEIGKTTEDLATIQLNYQNTVQELQDFKILCVELEQKYKTVQEENEKMNQQVGSLSRETENLRLSLDTVRTELSDNGPQHQQETAKVQERLHEVEQLQEELERRDAGLQATEQEKALVKQRLQQTLEEVQSLAREKEALSQLCDSLQAERDQLQDTNTDTQEQLRNALESLKQHQETITALKVRISEESSRNLHAEETQGETEHEFHRKLISVDEKQNLETETTGTLTAGVMDSEESEQQRKIRSLLQEKNELQQRLESVTAEKDQLKTDLQANIEMTIENQEELRILGDKLKRQQEIVTQEKKHAIKKDEVLAQTCERLAEVEGELQEKNEQLQEKQQQLLTAQEEMSKMQKKVNEMENLKNELKNQESRLERVEMERLELAQKLHESYEETKSITKERNALKESRESAEAERDQLKEYIRKLEAGRPHTEEESAMAPMQLSEHQENIAELRSRVAETEAEEVTSQEDLEESRTSAEEKSNTSLAASSVFRDSLKIQEAQDKQEQPFTGGEKVESPEGREVEERKERSEARDSALPRGEMERLQLCESLEESRRRLSSLAKERDDLQRLQGTLQAERDQLTERVRELSAKHQDTEEELTVAHCCLKEQKETIDKLRVNLSEKEAELVGVEKELEAARQELQKKLQELEEERQCRRAQAAQEAQEARWDAERFKEQLEAQRSALENMDSENRKLTQRLHENLEEMRAVTQERDDLRSVEETLKADRERLRESLEDAVARDLEKQEEARIAHLQLKAHQETIDELRGVVSKKTAEMLNTHVDLESAQAALKAQAQELEKKDHQLLQVENNLKETTFQTEVLKKQMETQNAALESSEKERFRLTEQLDENREEVQFLKEENESLRSAEEALREDKERLQGRLSRAEAQVLQMQKELKMAQVHQREHQETIAGLQRLVSERTEEVATMKADLETSGAQFQEKIRKLQNENERLLSKLKEVSETQKELKDQSVMDCRPCRPREAMSAGRRSPRGAVQHLPGNLREKGLRIGELLKRYSEMATEYECLDGLCLDLEKELEIKKELSTQVNSNLCRLLPETKQFQKLLATNLNRSMEFHRVLCGLKFLLIDVAKMKEEEHESINKFEMALIDEVEKQDELHIKMRQLWQEDRGPASEFRHHKLNELMDMQIEEILKDFSENDFPSMKIELQQALSDQKEMVRFLQEWLRTHFDIEKLKNGLQEQYDSICQVNKLYHNKKHAIVDEALMFDERSAARCTELEQYLDSAREERRALLRGCQVLPASPGSSVQSEPVAWADKSPRVPPGAVQLAIQKIQELQTSLREAKESAVHKEDKIIQMQKEFEQSRDLIVKLEAKVNESNKCLEKSNEMIQELQDKAALGAKPYKHEIEVLKTELVKSDLDKKKIAKEFEKDIASARALVDHQKEVIRQLRENLRRNQQAHETSLVLEPGPDPPRQKPLTCGGGSGIVQNTTVLILKSEFLRLQKELASLTQQNEQLMQQKSELLSNNQQLSKEVSTWKERSLRREPHGEVTCQPVLRSPARVPGDTPQKQQDILAPRGERNVQDPVPKDSPKSRFFDPRSKSFVTPRPVRYFDNSGLGLCPVEQASDTENTDPRLPPSTSLRDAPECRMQ